MIAAWEHHRCGEKSR